MKKRGIALFITLSLIMVITILVSKSLEISQNSLSGIKTIKKINQTNYLVRDVITILNKAVDDYIVDEPTLNLMLMPWDISEKGLSLIINLKSLSDKLDINYLLKDGNTSRVINYFLELNQVANSPFFYDLIHDTYDLNNEIRGGYDSEIILDDRYFENGKIYNYEQFEKILNRYSFLTNDVNIYKIPWRDIIFFGDGKTKKPLYANLLIDELKIAIDINFNDGEDYENTNKITEANSKELVDEFNLKVFTKGSSFLVLCKIEYIFDSISGQITLIYDLGKKEVVSIEEIL